MHILCPDPWPKDRHRHNRLLTSDFLGQLHRVLKKGGVFHFSSDDAEYFEPVIQLLENSHLFTRDDSKLDDITDIKSDFEIRWLNIGKVVQHCAFVSLADSFK